MKEFLLKFVDQNGVERSVEITGDVFVVGRHSGCDLAISDGRLSREHLKIERFADVLVVTDLNSSNGSKLNGAVLEKPVGAKEGDVLELGGFPLKLSVPEAEEKDEDDETPKAAAPPRENTAAPPSQKSSSLALLLLIPLGLFAILGLGAGVFYVMLPKDKDTVTSSDSTDSTETDIDYKDPSKTKIDSVANANDSPTTQQTATPVSTTGTPETPSNSSGTSTVPTPIIENIPAQTPVKKGDDSGKIESASAKFLRKIGNNDPRAFLTGEQAQILAPKVKQFSGSSVLADNIASAKKNASALQSLAASKNLKAEFVAAAAMAKLGNSHGDVLQTAQQMVDNLDKLSIQLGSELSNDSLLVIAAYNQGEAGEYRKLRDRLQQIADDFPEGARTIRSIWFLQKKNEITADQFEFALRFLAIGTIAQNPKDFNVNSSELNL